MRAAKERGESPMIPLSAIDGRVLLLLVLAAIFAVGVVQSLRQR